MDKVVIDPSKGGAVAPKGAAQSKALEVQPGRWVWDGVVKLLEVDLFSPAWEARHGAAMALRELLKVQGQCGGMRDDATKEQNAIAHEKWCNDLAVQFLCVFVLDRFGDFVSDQVTAPVRETVTQTLASLLLHMPRRSVLHVHTLLLQMIRQDFALPPKPAPAPGTQQRAARYQEVGHIWEVRHAGLLGIKYEVAVRSDLVQGATEDTVSGVKSEGAAKVEDQVKIEDSMKTDGTVKTEDAEGEASAKMEPAVKAEAEAGSEVSTKSEDAMQLDTSPKTENGMALDATPEVAKGETAKSNGTAKTEDAATAEVSTKAEESDIDMKSENVNGTEADKKAAVEVPGISESGKAVLRDVVDAAILGLGDRDDDVRSVAASCLLPVAQHVVDQLPEALGEVLSVLWSCLAEMKDDLSSSVGAVMDLLGKLVSYDSVIAILADDNKSLPITVLAPTLFPFFRHTIPNVRLAVVNTLHSFMTISSLPRDWVGPPFLRLLLQNLVVEEREEIRAATTAAWRLALSILATNAEWMQAVIPQPLILEWYAIVMTPMGVAIDPATFYSPTLADDGPPGMTERHNVDKNMLAQDLSLVTVEAVLKARVAAGTALADLIMFWPITGPVMEELFKPILIHYVDSTSMLQKFLAAVVVEEWAREHDRKHSTPLIDSSPLAQELSVKILSWLQAEPPAAYHEMAFTLARLHSECYHLLQAFVVECKLSQSVIPSLGTEIDITGVNKDCFTIDTAKTAVDGMFAVLKDRVTKGKKKELVVIGEKRNKIIVGIDRYVETKAQYDVRVSAAFAAAFVALKSAPDKVSPIVKGIMNGIKNEENVDLQNRSATAVATFIDFCAHHKLMQPPDKIVKNLCTFLCQDVERTPTFAYARKQLAGVLSFQPSSTKAANANGKNSTEKKDAISSEEATKARLARRGAGLAFDKLSSQFGPRLLDVVPGMWPSMAGGLLSACPTDSPTDADALMGKQFGQDVIDSLSVLEAVAPTLHEKLWPKMAELLPKMLVALRSRYAIIRQSAARCFAVVCDVMTVDAMRFVIENVIPFLGDALNLSNRQGATELMYHIVQRLDIKALPYVIFMVVPVLGRMSDSDDDVRSTATNTFASLVKMVPLEAGLPDPPGFSEDLLKRRETERQFLAQLLDGKKVEQYVIPVVIKAELRKYQQEGVNWLAFLAKYQLHGILCDDMGLGKTMQSICILAGKHFERAKKYEETNAPDVVHLPSLIVCPPTLTGHWYYEVLKYAENLRPILYTGNARDRAKLIGKLKDYDVVITSYEVVRNDIANLETLNWHYCILDEGHIIKNAKTKLTKAVKSIRAIHRLILSGTPIQNNVLELWSLFDFLMPGFLGTETSFAERFSKPILSNRDGKSKNSEAAALALEALHKQVLPFLLRRLKEDVLHDLPPKIIQDYYCELSGLQKYLYDDFAQSQALRTAEEVVQSTHSGEGKGQQHVFQSLQYLRKLCNHPALVLKNDKEAISKALAKVGGKSPLTDIQHAPKLLALRQLLTDCGIGNAPALSSEASKNDLADSVSESNGAFSQHRALIFCQMKQMLDIIETDLFKNTMPSVTYMRLDGSTDASKRHAIVQTFNSDPSIDCLLLTTHVGGLGLTLTGADTVIFVEHDWNPMKDLQAMDRAHRIGQKKVVNVYRLITKGTLEEKIMGLQRFKLNIANSVVTQQNAGLASMDTDLVLDLFKRTSEEEDTLAAAKKKAKESGKVVSQRNVLQGLEDLPTEEEYDGMDLSSFMTSLGKR